MSIEKKHNMLKLILSDYKLQIAVKKYLLMEKKHLSNKTNWRLINPSLCSAAICYK